MTIHKMKTTAFEETNYVEWKEIAVKSLKGMPFEKLITKTPEGIDSPTAICRGTFRQL